MRYLTLLLFLGACAGDTVDPVEVETSTSALSVAAIPRASSWRFRDNGANLGTTWRGAMDDTAWATGAGPLGYGESYLATTVGYGPSATNRYITTYFRHTFYVADPAAVSEMFGELMYDDGAVIYLNGTEIWRASMPSGAISYRTLSTGHEAGNAYEAWDWTDHKNLLVAGNNVLAVEVHQAAATSSDLVFDLSLTMLTSTLTVPLEEMPRDQGWSYWDNGGYPGDGWKTDGGGSGWDWGRAPLGYGETYLTTTVSFGPNASNKPITTYFTTNFWVENPSAVTEMIGEVMYDDGFVVYINGVEIARAAMPAGTITPTTRALGHEANGAYQTFDWSAMRGALVGGPNRVSVEVHQQAASSSDLVFGMAIRLRGPEAPPPDGGDNIARGSVWRFWDGPAEPAEYHNWTRDGFNDATWKSGPGPFGYGESYIVTPVSYGPDPSRKNITTYFRHYFTVADPSAQTQILAELLYDDGVVVYLNGSEITRLAMPSGNIQHTTLSTGHESGLYEPLDWTRYNGRLVQGLNVIGVEVHQASGSSSDLSFDLSLETFTPAVCGIPGCGPAEAPPLNAGLAGVWVGTDAVWAVGNPGVIGRRTEAGGEWCWCDRETTIAYSEAWGSADDDVWIVGEMSEILHWDGTAFTVTNLFPQNDLYSVWGSGPDDVWAVGSGGAVFHWDGVEWQDRFLPADQTLLSVWGASADEVYVSGTEPAPYPGDPTYDGSSAVIHKWDPVTATWTRVLTRTMYYGYADFDDLSGTGPDDIWAVGGNHPAGAACSYSHVVHYDGTTWSTVPVPDELQCRSFQAVEAGGPGADAWVFGFAESDSGLRYDDGAWSEAEPGTDDLDAVDHRGDRLWAVGSDNEDGHKQKILEWNGSTWVRSW